MRNELRGTSNHERSSGTEKKIKSWLKKLNLGYTYSVYIYITDIHNRH
jgi:hypothetical protein